MFFLNLCRVRSISNKGTLPRRYNFIFFRKFVARSAAALAEPKPKAQSIRTDPRPRPKTQPIDSPARLTEPV